MRHYFARLLRRAANRLDPPRYWGNVLTPNTSGIEGFAAGTNSTISRTTVTANASGRVSVAWQDRRSELEQWKAANRLLQDAKRNLRDAEARLLAVEEGRESA